MPDLEQHPFVQALQCIDTATLCGRITRITPTYVEADGPGVSLGSLCRIDRYGQASLLVEVAKVEVGRVTLVPFGPLTALHVGDRVEALTIGATLPVGQGYLGRIIDALGNPLDGKGPINHCLQRRPLAGATTAVLDRVSPTQPLETGFRAIDSLLTLGIGQRVGIFAGSGVGKTSLLGGMARHVAADICVLCLVGERGREAEEFWEEALTEEARKRSIMVLASSDQPAIMRARSVLVALTLAEYFREAKSHVLLLLDSMTRYALALREIGLAAGEPPTVRAYTPSVFAALPKVIERCGALKQGGAITAVMTVLAESDDIDDPMTDTLRALLDGHIVLTRELAEKRHFPAIDVPRSISRVSGRVSNKPQQRAAADAISQLSLHDSSRMLIESGLYIAGGSSALDRAIALRPELMDFLRQEPTEFSSSTESTRTLQHLLGTEL
ncbi:MAG: FliI/YscN family ATPase [Pseudomonas sp.]|uniref:FliI/YscN family ATPase n=1 Tax=Stenotrophomonas sp. TaxID=69392 RepID=UPI003D6D29E1